MRTGTAYQRYQAATTPWDRGVAYAEYQTEGLYDREANRATVQAWRRQAMAQTKTVRSEAKKQQLNGFIRGLSDWLHNTPAAPSA